MTQQEEQQHQAVHKGPAPTQALALPGPSPLNVEVAEARARELRRGFHASLYGPDGVVREWALLPGDIELVIDFQSDLADGDLVTVLCGPLTISVRPRAQRLAVEVPTAVRDLAYRLGVFLLSRGAARSFILGPYGMLFLLLLAQHAQLEALVSRHTLAALPLPPAAATEEAPLCSTP